MNALKLLRFCVPTLFLDIFCVFCAFLPCFTRVPTGISNGFKKSTTEYLFIHSDDDKTVPISAGLDFFKGVIGNNPRVSYIRLSGMGHRTSYDSVKGKAYYEDLKYRYKEYLKDQDVPREDREHLFNLLVDKDKWLDMLNYALADSITNFIRS